MKIYQKIVVAFGVVMIVAFTLSISFVTSFASAQEASSSASTSDSVTATTSARNVRNQILDQKQAQVKSVIAQMQAYASSSACTIFDNRLNARLSMYKSKLDNDETIYQTHADKLLIIANKLDAQGVSTFALRADITTLGLKIQTFDNARIQLESALGNTASTTCGMDDGHLQTSIQTVRTSQKNVAQSATDLYQFIKGALRTDILNIQTTLDNKAK